MNLRDPKRDLVMRKLKDNIDDAHIMRLFNAAAEFVNEFTGIYRNFVGDENSEDSTGTTDEEERGDE